MKNNKNELTDEQLKELYFSSLSEKVLNNTNTKEEGKNFDRHVGNIKKGLKEVDSELKKEIRRLK